ncbi:MAG: hypothetical protein IKT70_06475 [Clostridia bacterium]|nr:hypothetical protein [Clostridia bacterium]
MSDEASTPTPEGLSSGLSALLSDPDTIKKAAALLPDLIPLFGGILGGGNSGKEKTENTDDAEKKESGEERENNEPSIPATVLPKAKGDARPDSLALINALKPYLSPERRKKLDRIYSMTRMLEAMSTSFSGDEK